MARAFVGSDVAAGVHRACALGDGGRGVLDRAVENGPEGPDASPIGARPGGEPSAPDLVGSFARFLESTPLAEGVARVHAPGIAVNGAGRGFPGGERTP